MNKPKHAASRGNRHTLRRRVSWTLLAVLFISWGGPAANAFWQTLSSSNFGAAKADAMPQGGSPVASLNGTNATVSWAAVATPGGHAVAGYTVARYSTASGGTKIAAGGGCTGTVSTLSCVEQNLPAGTWYYTVTPVISLWTGAESARSGGVNSDSTPPTISVTSVSPTPNGAGYNNTSPVTVNLSAVDNAGGSGVANIQYTVDGGSTVTVYAATAAVSVTGDGTHSVSYTATDVAGNTSNTQTQAVKIDTTKPVVGVASISPTPNSLGYNRTSTVTVNLSATDVGGSGIASITYHVDNLAPATVNAATAAVAVSGEGTHTVYYSATDVAGNPSDSQTQTVTIDTTAPTVSAVTMANGGTAKTADKGDTLSIVFSTDMDAHTLCSAWNSTSATQSVAGTASISTGNVLTFFSPSCTAPAFGSVSLNAPYNTGTAARTFAATMAWTQSTGTLVITFNTDGSGGAAGTGLSPATPVYTPAPGAADKAGNAVGTVSTGGQSKF
ncbi:OmpL47-type beta-barrel domain-containing protein [Arthrobacter bambusae]|uniref:OmpL47-type beta-barrel domain-containing protein n=1 Tax=Arthrobacter bambusae TaxID=1338426 RepID=UPI0027803A52|nr:hypothetical protein [Arthrobacter bambusae]MDQ0029207.1 putative heme/steroid binding protein [Arthrobacter bambusae]MDQ0098116.1 putative heme/steroid binding protein [Arthrobacter bambusae]